MMVCIMLIWSLLTVLQESDKLDAIFIVSRRRKERRKKQVHFGADSSPFLVKSQLKKINPSINADPLWIKEVYDFFPRIFFLTFYKFIIVPKSDTQGYQNPLFRLYIIPILHKTFI